MGLLDKFKNKNKQPFPMSGPDPYNRYQQPYQNMQNPYGSGPNFGQQIPYPQSPQRPFQQNFYPQSQQQPFNQHQNYYQQPYVPQPQLNAYQQYVNQNKILQPVPFQDQPVIQSHNSSAFQQQSQFPMTGQPPERQEEASPGFFSRMLGGDTSITGVIGGMQKAVQAAQQVTPMIQQYAPVVKNFPSLYKIFKAVNTDDPIDTKKGEKQEIIIEEPKTERKKRRKIRTETEIEAKQVPEKIESNTKPKPKLFM